MKLFIKLRNKYVTALMSLVLLVMASIGLFNLNAPKSVEASMVNFEKETTISVSNGSFSSFSSSSSYPYTLSNYSNTGNKTPSMKTGAINISDNVYKNNYKKYGLSEYANPKGVGSDNYILMINTEEDSNYTYLSNEFTLSANGYYYVTVSAKTIGDNSLASVFLQKDGQVFENCIIKDITSTGWSNYTFFVATNSYEELKLQFGMQIGSPNTRASGCVLFDELHAGQISYETYVDAINTFSSNTSKYVEFRSPNAYKEYNFDNNIVNYVNANQELIKDGDGKLNPTIVSGNYFESPVSTGGSNDVTIDNNEVNIIADNGSVTYKGQEEVLQPNSTYKFAVNVKASSVTSGSAFVKLEEIVDDSEDYDDFMDSTLATVTPKNANLTISSATTNTVTGGYTEYAIYVTTGSLASSKVQFSFGIGSESSNATANVSFKRYSIERVPYSAFSKASAGSTIGKIDISDRISLSSSEFSNYTFDKMQSDSFDGVQYPSIPTDWTKANSGEGYQLSGVVNLKEFDKVMNKYADYINTLSTPANLTATTNNNVLMIYNGTHSSQSYTSKTKTLTANKFYKVTTFVNTHLWDADASGVTVVAKAGDTVIAKATDIKTLGQWQRVVIYIDAPTHNVDVSLELALGYENKVSSGYAFFDNIMFEESETKGEFSSRFDNFLVASNGEVSVDLNNPMLTYTTNRDFNTPVLFKGENNGNTTYNAGVVDLTSDLKSVIADSKMEALRALLGDNRNVLAIASVLNKDGYYKYTSAINYSFDADKYYKLTLSLFTDNIAQEVKENDEDRYDNGVLAEGVNLELTGLENAKFNYVVSNGEWTQYEFYIGVGSSATATLVFSMGNETHGCYGSAFIGNIALTEIEQEEFDASANSSTSLKIDTIEQAEEESQTSSSSSNNFNWQYIPTIATFLAIVIAVVGIFVRRNIKFKKRVGNKRANYDRDITVLQNKYRRLASDLRDKDVRELTKECQELVDLRAEYEEKYKDAIARLRSAKLSNRDGSKRHEIVAIEREVKHISREVARYGVQVNNYENEIEFMQTEAYLIDLEKRMMREDEYARNQVKKEAQMPEEKRLQAIAKRQQKQERLERKAERKAERLAEKQQSLEEQREAVQQQLADAKAKDEQYVKQQELIKIKMEEARLAKEKAKADKELQKLEKQKQEQERERLEVEKELEQAKAKQAEEGVESVETEVTEGRETFEKSDDIEEIETADEVIAEPTQTAEAREEAEEEKSEEAEPKVVEVQVNEIENTDENK